MTNDVNYLELVKRAQLGCRESMSRLTQVADEGLCAYICRLTLNNDLAEDILRALCSLGVRCVFATHLHELGESVATLSDGSPGSSVAYSLVAGIDHGSGDGGKRTYKILRGPPMGKSFASDIAEQCGISYHQIRDLFRKRGLIE